MRAATKGLLIVVVALAGCSSTASPIRSGASPTAIYAPPARLGGQGSVMYIPGSPPPPSPVEVPPAERIDDPLPVMQNPEAYFGRNIEICGDLARGVDLNFSDGKQYPGYFLFHTGDAGSFMHGRSGIFLPEKKGLAKFVGKSVCVLGKVLHRSGMTPNELAKLPGREMSSGAIDTQWHFNVTRIAIR